MSDDTGKTWIRGFKTTTHPDGSLVIGEPVTGISISQKDRELQDDYLAMMRDASISAGHLNADESMFIIVGKIHLVEPDVQEEI